MANDLNPVSKLEPNAEDLVPAVSVVVPSFNHAAFVEQALRSIFRQTVRPLELLVIDDGSLDGSAEVIEKTLKDCPFPCEFIARSNAGLCATLNESIEKTSGEFFAYIGSDDVWLPEFLAHRLEKLNEDAEGVLAYGPLHVIDAENEIIGSAFDFEPYRHLSTRDRLLYGFAPTSSAIVYRKRFLDENRWDPAVKLEDYDLFLRLCMQGEFLFDERIDAAWRLHEANTSSKYEFMMRELTNAVERNAEVLCLGKQEMHRIVSRRKLSYIDKYIADHKRGPAARLFVENLSAFPSMSVMARKAIKILTPFAVSDRRLNRMMDNALKRSETYINDVFEIVPVTDPERLRNPVARPERFFG